MVDKQLAAEEWYHGLLPREDIKIKHYIINHSDNKYTIEKFAFPSISELVKYHLKTKESLVKSTDVRISNPVVRQSWELHHEDVELTKKLGEGAFGEVHMGILKLRGKKGETAKVAVKLAKLEALTKEQIKEIMSEARLMRHFDHPNVVKFYGVAAGQEPLMVIMELANCGALDSYLQKNDLPVDKKNEMVVQAAWGIEYMHTKNVLHRDIAARNCLYGDGKVKIADFGLSREGTVYQMDPHKRVPIRWLAPETLKTAMYSQKTDVFSYGIMCWEIYFNGIEPYPGMTVAEVNQNVKEGYRMELPPYINPEVARIIKTKCWPESPNERFSMADIAKHLQRILGISRPDFNAIKHYIINHSDNKYTIEKFAFPSISELVKYHLKTKESLVKSTDVRISNPVVRQSWELHHEDVELTKKLGEGAFGEVHMGILKLRGKKGETAKVAVKLAKLEALTKEQIKEIMSEARLMRHFDHPNVVKFYGVAAGQEPLMVIMELANCGALDSYLQKNDLPVDKKNEMVVQAAWGIEYMHTKNVLHRDIAARNCLYGDGKVKIADFGLSREGTVYQMDPHKRVPIRWLAPETLKTAMYSQKTDVFSYGIMCWEIYFNGIEPYPGMTVAEVNQNVKEGYRMELPPYINPEVARIIKTKCWPESPNERFSMADIAKHLQRILGISRPDFNAQYAQITKSSDGGRKKKH